MAVEQLGEEWFKAIPRIDPSLVAIQRVVDKKLVQTGTGTLLRCGEYFMIVTATHVITTASEEGAGVYAAVDGLPYPINDCAAIMVADESIDIGAWILEASFVEKFGQTRFLNRADLRIEIEGDSGFLVQGFPSTWHNYDVSKMTGVRLLCQQFEGEAPANLGGYKKKNHLLLNRRPEDTQPDGHDEPFPRELGGISGGGVWSYHGDINARPLVADSFKLVGIQTGLYSKPPLIKATRIHFLFVMLWENFPDMRDALRVIPA